MDVVTRIRYEVDNKQVLDTATAVEDLVNANKDLQDTAGGSLDGATAGLKKYEGAVNAAGKELDNNRSKTTAWQRATASSGKVARKFGDEITIAGKSLTEISDLLTGAGKNFSSFSGSAAKGGATAARGFFTARTAAIAFQLSIGLILGIITVLIAALSRSQKVIDAVSDALSVATSVFDVFADRAALVGQAIFELFTGDPIAAVKSYTEATKGLITELTEEASRAYEVAQATREIRREQILLTAERARANQIIKEQGLISEDLTKSNAERQAAARKAFEVESQFIQKSTENLRKSLATKLAIDVDVDEVIEGLNNATLSFEDLRSIAGDSLSLDADVEEIVNLYKDLQEQQAASLETQTTLNNRINTIDEQARQKYLAYIAEREKAETEFATVQLQLRDALRASEELDAEEQINLNRQIAIEQIAALEKLTREKAAAAKVQFDAEEEFATLRIRANAEAEKEIAAFRVSEQKRAIDDLLKEELAYIDLLSASGDERLSLEEFQARERVAVQVKALQDIRAATVAAGGEGVNAAVLEIDVQIAKLQAEDVATLTANNERIRTERLKALTDQENIENARVDILRESNSEELSLAQSQELEKLRIAKRGIAARLEIQKEAGASEAELTLLNLQGDKIQQQIDDLENIRLDPIERLMGKIKDAFKLDDETLAEITNQLGGAIQNITAGVDALREAELSRIDIQIEAAQERQEELRSLLEQEQADQAAGLANNVSLYESALAEQEQIEQDNVNRRLEIQRRAANQQLIIDSTQQASSIALAATKLIASEASKGLVGLVIGIGALGLLFSTVARAKANAAAFATAPVLRDGARITDGMLKGPSHEQGGIPLLAEGGEHVFSRKNTNKYSDLFNAIQDKKIDGMTPEAVLKAVGKKPMFNSALGTPVIKVSAPEARQEAKQVQKGVHFVKMNDKTLIRIDESGPVRRMEKVRVS